MGRTLTDDPEEEKAQKALKSQLNKITPDNFERIVTQVRGWAEREGVCACLYPACAGQPAHDRAAWVGGCWCKGFGVKGALGALARCRAPCPHPWQAARTLFLAPTPALHPPTTYLRTHTSLPKLAPPPPHLPVTPQLTDGPPPRARRRVAQITEKINERKKAKTLVGFIDQIFDKALIEITFAQLYANLVAA